MGKTVAPAKWQQANNRVISPPRETMEIPRRHYSRYRVPRVICRAGPLTPDRTGQKSTYTLSMSCRVGVALPFERCRPAVELPFERA
jgi:hypothetical protein